MLISPSGLLSGVRGSFSDTARAALPSVAEPAWFAPPVDVRGDGESLTILFRVPAEVAELRVEPAGSSVVLRGRVPTKDGRFRSHSAMRVFALPFEAARGSVSLVRSDELAIVSIRRRHPDARRPSFDSQETAT
jgi:HSP20 family molecular chaperone IbpA